MGICDSPPMRIVCDAIDINIKSAIHNDFSDLNGANKK